MSSPGPISHCYISFYMIIYYVIHLIIYWKNENNLMGFKEIFSLSSLNIGEIKSRGEGLKKEKWERKELREAEKSPLSTTFLPVPASRQLLDLRYLRAWKEWGTTTGQGPEGAAWSAGSCSNEGAAWCLVPANCGELTAVRGPGLRGWMLSLQGQARVTDPFTKDFVRHLGEVTYVLVTQVHSSWRAESILAVWRRSAPTPQEREGVERRTSHLTRVARIPPLGPLC